MRRSALILGNVLAILTVLLTMVNCTPAGPKTSYKIGVLTDVTGPVSGFGIPSRDGAILATEEINKAGGINGRNVELVVYDAESDESKAVLLAKRLIEQDKVVAMIGPVSTGANLAAVDTISKSETPEISLGAATEVWMPTKKWMFSAVGGQNYSAEKLASYLQKQGLTRIAYEYADIGFGQTSWQWFQKVAPNFGLTVTDVEKHGGGDTDMTPQITKLMASKPQAIFLAGYIADSAIFLKNAKTLGVTIPIVSDYGGPMVKQFLDLAGPAANGLVYPMGKTLIAEQLPDSDPQKAYILKFRQAYQAKFQQLPPQLATNGYDTINIIANAIKSRVDSKLDPAADLSKVRAQIRDGIEGTKNYVGGWGIFNYSPDNHNGLSAKDMIMIRIADGKWTLAKEN